MLVTLGERRIELRGSHHYVALNVQLVLPDDTRAPNKKP
jgi:hypothetical protein